MEKAAQLEPANACKYYYNLGALYTNAGQVDPALDTFKKAITADPNCADAYYQTGINLMAKVTTTPDGKMIPAAGTSEAFQKYLSLKPDGPYAQSAKEMLTTLGSTVDNTYKNPNAPPAEEEEGRALARSPRRPAGLRDLTPKFRGGPETPAPIS